MWHMSDDEGQTKSENVKGADQTCFLWLVISMKERSYEQEVDVKYIQSSTEMNHHVKRKGWVVSDFHMWLWFELTDLWEVAHSSGQTAWCSADVAGLRPPWPEARGQPACRGQVCSFYSRSNWGRTDSGRNELRKNQKDSGMKRSVSEIHHNQRSD